MTSAALELPPGFVCETLATNLNAMTAVAVSSDGRVFLADQTGKVLVWKNGQVLPQPMLTVRVTDYWERGLIGLTLHPRFPETPYMYVAYVTDRPFVHHVMSRFTVAGDTADRASEFKLLEGDDQSRLGGAVPAGHQGGMLRFDQDGKLFVSIGEQTAGEPAQRLDTLQGKILRLNADGSIPEDNPFFTRTTGKYRAIWAFGVRNSFGLAVQPLEDGGRIFFTDVGGSAFEEVNRLVPGGNYGWPHAEGYSTNASYLAPIYTYPPAIGRSVCGGAFYPRKATAFPEKWRGRFFFVDFMAHWLKAMNPDAPTNITMFARGLDGPIAVEVESNGSLLVLNRGAIWRDPKRFVPNRGSLIRIRYSGTDIATTSADGSIGALGLPQNAGRLPRKLSETQLLAVLGNCASLPELHAYEVNLPEWTPGLRVAHYFALPRGRKLLVRPELDWMLPPGAVVIKHIQRARNAAPVETRVIVADGAHVSGASYRWRQDQSDADRVDDPEFLQLGPNEYWVIPGRQENREVLAFDTAYRLDLSFQQLNRLTTNADKSVRVSGENGSANRPINQIAHFRELGLLDPVPSNAEISAAPRFAHWTDESAPVELRVRSYLDVHCAHCHQPGGPSRGLFDARFAVPLAGSGLIDSLPAAGDLGIAGAKIIASGDPEGSILYERLKRMDFFRMPPVQYHNQLSPILPLVAEWIRGLKSPPHANPETP